MGAHIAIGDTDQLVTYYADLLCARERTSSDDGRLHFAGCPSGDDYEVPRKVWGSLVLPTVVRLTMERWWESSQN